MKASDPATHMNAPAATWSSSADTLKRRGASKYERYRTRSEKVRMADSAVFCRSATSRYGTIAQRGHRPRLGHGKTTGHQNIIEARKKHACSTSCQNSE